MKADGLTRVEQATPPAGGATAVVSAARNEDEVFQVVVTAPPQAASKVVSATLSDLVGPGICTGTTRSCEPRRSRTAFCGFEKLGTFSSASAP